MGAPFLPWLRKSYAAGAALLPLGGDLLVSPQQWQWQHLLSKGGSVSLCAAVLAPRRCGTCLRRQLVIKLWRRVFWVLTFIRSSLRWLNVSCSFSLQWGALHLSTCFPPSTASRDSSRCYNWVGHQKGLSTKGPSRKLIQINQWCKADLPAVIKHSSSDLA